MSRYIWRKKTEMMKAQWQMRQTASLDFSIIEKLWNPGATKRQSTPFQDSSICLQNWTVRLNLTTSTWPFSVKTLSLYLSQISWFSRKRYTRKFTFNKPFPLFSWPRWWWNASRFRNKFGTVTSLSIYKYKISNQLIKIVTDCYKPFKN